MSYQRNAIDSVKRGSDKKSLKGARPFASEGPSPTASAQPMRLSRHELALALDRREQYQRLKVQVNSSGNLDAGVRMNEESNALMHLGSEDPRVGTPSQDAVAASDGEATPAPVINIQTSNQSQPDLQR